MPSKPGASASESRAKRQTILAACQICRQKKVKCDGQRPCGYCKAHELQSQCFFEANEDETHRVAAKRKHNEITQARDELQMLFTQIAERNEADVSDIVRRIRWREKPISILRSLDHTDALRVVSVPAGQAARLSHLLQLLQGYAPLDEVIQSAGSIPMAETNQMYSPIESEAFAESVTSSGAMRLASSSRDTTTERGSGSRGGSNDPGERINVPARPWSHRRDDEVSELISVFFNLLWPYWRLVEKDQFVEAMRAQELNSHYCSPFLVNSILALASMFSECEAAFAIPGHLLTRGKHFHDEAMQLWLLEEAHPSLKNVQGLTALSVECGLCGKDRLGESLLKTAKHLQDERRKPSGLTNLGDSIVEFMKADRCLAWSVGILEVSSIIGRLKPATTIENEIKVLPPIDMRVTLLDDPQRWSFQGELLILDPNTLWRERCELVWKIQTFLNALLWKVDKVSSEDYIAVGDKHAEIIRAWLDNTPSILHWKARMPVPIFDLHGQYHCALMTIYSTVKGRVIDCRHEQKQEMIQRVLSRIIECATEATRLLRQYREQYSLKTVSIYLVQLASMASGLLLQAMQYWPLTPLSVSPLLQSQSYDDVKAAFAECFHYLMGTGLQTMLPRAIARMHQHTAKVLKVELLPPVQQMLDIAAEAAWQPSDVHSLSSSYPNFAMAHQAVEDGGMEDLLKKWEGLNTK